MRDLPYRQNVCMLLYSPDLKVWIGQRFGADTWQLPQGGVTRGQPSSESALRELEEELGVASSDLGIPVQLAATHRYDFADPNHHFRGKYRGQEQTFWMVPFLGRDSSIQVSRVKHPEFSAWRWVEPELLEQAVEPVRRAGYRQPVAEFMARTRPGSPPSSSD